MKIYKEIEATVGQVVKDLEEIAEKNPGSTFDYNYGNGNYLYFTDVKFEAGFVFFVSKMTDEGMAVEELLENLKRIKEDTKVLLDCDGCEWFSLKIEDDGKIFHYDEEEEYNWFSFNDQDVRCVTGTQVKTDLKRFAKKYPDIKVACWTHDEEDLIYLGGVIWDDWKYWLYDRSEDLTVSALYKEISLDSLVLFRSTEDYEEELYIHSLEMDDDGHIFHLEKDDDEDILVCRLTETLWTE